MDMGKDMGQMHVRSAGVCPLILLILDTCPLKVSPSAATCTVQHCTAP